MHVLLAPFLGIIKAPYMTITWVSDQHLYLVLPVMLGMWMGLFEKIKFRHSIILPLVVVLYFGYKTYDTVPAYKNQFTFYEKSLEYNPYNIPIAYNLAHALIIKGQWTQAYNLLVETHALAEEEPILKSNPFYFYFNDLYENVKQVIEKHAM
jgi:hypothetical protein